ncbi:ABC transporter ATP-binding protein [Shinella sp.]|uniref:ABC transporter ATP-binding protein n=1 Tax=Shinella sp. TaxID=1870904 RepID=UPI003F71E957
MQPGKTRPRPHPADGGYHLEGLTFSAGGRLIVRPAEVSLPAGRIYGLVGPNGSGKSTLMKMMARQLSPTGGTVRLAGRPLPDFSDREFARDVAFMPQFTPPTEGMSVGELVALGRFPWHGALGRFGPADREKVALALEQAELTGLTDRLVDSLSGGERQRAWFAMMLAQDTRWLLLDEPTSALDIAHQVSMLALVRRLSRERGAGVVAVLHDINMAARVCDEILALSHGELIARGAPDAILRPDVLAGIYDLAMDVLPNPQGGPPISYVSELQT